MNCTDLPPEVQQALWWLALLIIAAVGNAIRAKFNAGTELDNLTKAQTAATLAVKAVEQIKANAASVGKPPPTPEQAKEKALDIAASLAPQADPAKLDPLIEAAHFEKDNAPVIVTDTPV